MNKAQRLTALEIRLTRLEGHMLPDRVALIEDMLEGVLDDAAEFEAECAETPEHAPSVPRPREYSTTAPDVIDNEADFQSFMAAYDMPDRITRLLEMTYHMGGWDLKGCDFKAFLGDYDMPARLTRLMRLTYLCGVADRKAPITAPEFAAEMTNGAIFLMRKRKL